MLHYIALIVDVKWANKIPFGFETRRQSRNLAPPLTIFDAQPFSGPAHLKTNISLFL
jgi:hypothetical protein